MSNTDELVKKARELADDMDVHWYQRELFGPLADAVERLRAERDAALDMYRDQQGLTKATERCLADAIARAKRAEAMLPDDWRADLKGDKPCQT